MQIVCPNCKTSYQIADMAIGASGRSVRCVRCQTMWRATPPAVAAAEMAVPADETDSVEAFRAELGTESLVPKAIEPEAAPPIAPIEQPAELEPALAEQIGVETAEAATDAAPDASAESEPVALSDIPIPAEPAPPLVPAADADGAAAHGTEMENGRPDVESVAARRTRTAARKRRPRSWASLPIAIVVLMVLSAAALGFRKEIVRHAPQLASFYGALGLPVNLRGLAFTDLKIGNEIHDGVPVLVIEGMIVSTVSKPVDLPRMRFALRSASGAEVYSWTAPPSQPALGPFEAIPFRTRLASPPADGHDIQVRFFTRRDAVAGLH